MQSESCTCKLTRYYTSHDERNRDQLKHSHEYFPRKTNVQLVELWHMDIELEKQAQSNTFETITDFRNVPPI